MTKKPPSRRLSVGALVLYKSGPARVVLISDKIDIQLANGKNRRVRDKDVVHLHDGPIHSLADLDSLRDAPLNGEVEEAWELLGEECIPLEELSELIFGEATPATLWSSWIQVTEDIYFHGTPGQIQGYSADRVARVNAERSAKAVAQQQKEAFLQRLRDKQLEEEDYQQLSDVEMVALGRSEVSRILRDLGRDQRPESGHHLLLETGYWEPLFNPYPIRMGVETTTAEGEIPELADEQRVDLTHLTCWAIDDSGNQDPDDAISLEGEQLWVHVADVAALVQADSALDLAARARGANLYLPEGTLSMLPAAITEQLGLGLQQRSPALSFRFTLSAEGEVGEIEVMTSWIRVTRTTYDAVEHEIESETFAPLYQKALLFQQKRSRQGAIRLILPEVKIRVKPDPHEISITPLPRLRSRDLVTEFMLMAGEAAARFAQQHEIPFPYSTQPPPEGDENGNPYPQPETPAEMYRFRRRFRRSQLKSQPEPHSGLGMALYSQVTSPLRRYLDLVAHQQLRRWIEQQPLLDGEILTERVGAAEAVIGSVRRAERFSNQHWTLLWLQRNPGWSGEAILVDRMKQRGTFLIPTLGMECKARLKQPAELNQSLTLKLSEVDLPELTGYFQVESRSLG
ncbi:MAG: RNB domain-containing ribonuclease [Gammaproteobacteria bacterium]|nr:RNB domain-containing ribonuclease [Gammaproteobacteria bacterium]